MNMDDALDRLERDRYALVHERWPEAPTRSEDFATVRSALQQLREERDRLASSGGAYMVRAVAAEAEVRQLRDERDALEARLVLGRDWLGKDLARAEAAEAEARRLREGLRETADELASRRGMIDRAVAAEKFRALLADSPDGSETEGGEA